MPTPRVGTSPVGMPASPMVTNPTRSDMFPPLALLERGVEGLLGRREVEALDEGSGLRGAVGAIHAAVLPLDRERPIVADAVQRAHDLLEVHAAAARRAEIPAPSGIAEVEVRAEDAGAAVEIARGVLDVHVIDAVGEALDEEHGIDELVVEMAGVEVDPEGGAVADGLERLLRGDDVVGDLRRMDLQAEAHALLVEHVHDRVTAVGKLAVAGLASSPGRAARGARDAGRCMWGRPGLCPPRSGRPSRPARGHRSPSSRQEGPARQWGCPRTAP